MFTLLVLNRISVVARCCLKAILPSYPLAVFLCPSQRRTLRRLQVTCPSISLSAANFPQFIHTLIQARSQTQATSGILIPRQPHFNVHLNSLASGLIRFSFFCNCRIHRLLIAHSPSFRVFLQRSLPLSSISRQRNTRIRCSFMYSRPVLVPAHLCSIVRRACGDF